MYECNERCGNAAKRCECDEAALVGVRSWGAASRSKWYVDAAASSADRMADLRSCRRVLETVREMLSQPQQIEASTRSTGIWRGTAGVGCELPRAAFSLGRLSLPRGEAAVSAEAVASV